MKFIAAGVALLTTAFVLSPAHADEFSLSYTSGDADYSDGPPTLVTSTFDGTLNGNLITDISDVTVDVNGQSIGPVYAESWDFTSGYFVSGGSVVSLDGTQNNFLFINAPYVEGDYGPYTGYLYSISGSPGTESFVHIDDNSTYAADVSFDTGSPFNSSLVITDITRASVPDGGTTAALLGLGLAALALARRKAVSAQA
jgi:hypothetical protein